MFDLLVDSKGAALTEKPLSDRRKRLEAFSEKFFGEGGRIQISPATCDRNLAQQWFEMVGPSLEGVVAKRLDQPYRCGSRDGMVKVKKLQTMECVVGGFTYGSDDRSVNSLLLGLYDEQRNLRYVGGTKLIHVEGSRVLKELESIIEPPGFVRSKSGRFISTFPEVWTPVLPAIVIEVRYDRFTGGHFRHGTKFLRWRPDKSPEDCLLSESN